MGPMIAAAHQGYEERLADRAMEGDEAAFQALIGHNLDRVLNVCYRTCLDRAEAERVACDSVAGATRRLPELRLSGGGFGSLWLSASTGCALDEAVRRVADRHQGALAPEPTRIYCDPSAAARAADHQLLIRSAVARLHPRHRKLLALADGSGLSCAEMGAMFGEPVRSVAASLGRARLGLATELRGGARPELAAADECATVPARFVLRDAGELGADEEEDLTRHLTFCAACTASARASTEARSAYAQWLDIAPSPAMLVRLRALSPGERRRVEALRLLRSSAARRLVLTSAVSASAFVIAAAMALRSDSPSPAELHAGAPAAVYPSTEDGSSRAGASRESEAEQGTEEASERSRRARELASRGGQAGGEGLSPQGRARSRAERERERVRRRRGAGGKALTAGSERSAASEEEPASRPRRGGLLRESIGSLVGTERPSPVGIGHPRPPIDGESPQSGDSSERPSDGGSDGGGRQANDERDPPSEDR